MPNSIIPSSPEENDEHGVDSISNDVVRQMQVMHISRSGEGKATPFEDETLEVGEYINRRRKGGRVKKRVGLSDDEVLISNTPLTPSRYTRSLRSRPQYPTSPYVYELSPTPSPTPSPPLTHLPPQTTPSYSKPQSRMTPACYTPKRNAHRNNEEENQDPFFDPGVYPILRKSLVGGLGTVLTTGVEGINERSQAVVEEEKRRRGRRSSVFPPAPLIDLTTLPQTPRRRLPKLAITPLPPLRNWTEDINVAEESNVRDAGQQITGYEVEKSEMVTAVGLDWTEGSDELSNTLTDVSSPVEAKVQEVFLELEDIDAGISSIRAGYVDDVVSVSEEEGDHAFENEISEYSPPVQLATRRVKKRVVYSSDEEEEILQVQTILPVSGPSRTRRPSADAADLHRETITISSSSEPESSPPPRRTPKPKGRRLISRFVDAEAGAHSGSEDDEDDDDSAGSLRDFIVDDDEVEYWSEDGEQDGGKAGDSDCILTYSPPRKLVKRDILSDINNAIIDLVISSDDEAVEPRKDSRSLPRRAVGVNKATPATPAKSSRALKKEWLIERVRLVDDLMTELDETVFDGQLVKQHGVRAEWSDRLLTTAGRANWKKKRQDGAEDVHNVFIELSTKVLDERAKVLNTVAHELCHVATWLISKEMKNPHGKIFKSWASKIMRVRRDIKITTKHSYVIAHKYEWKCINVSCGQIYGRHSKSIDVTKVGCGRCKSKLEPQFGRPGGTKPSAFQTFQKQNMKLAKATLPTGTLGDVMRALSERWKVTGPDVDQAEHDRYWQRSLRPI